MQEIKHWTCCDCLTTFNIDELKLCNYCNNDKMCNFCYVAYDHGNNRTCVDCNINSCGSNFCMCFEESVCEKCLAKRIKKMENESSKNEAKIIKDKLQTRSYNTIMNRTKDLK